MDIKNIILNKIQEIQKRKPAQKYVWNDSLYEDIQYLTIDERGQLGEEITVDILKSFGCKIQFNSSITEETKGWDLISNKLKIEIKFATITIGTGLFQHENLHPQRDFDAILFIDVAPNEVYLTAISKKNINWKELYRRENGIYKCDFSINHIKENNIKKFNKYRTKLIESTQDFFDIYKSLEIKTK